MLSKTNHTPPSITSPATIRNRNTSTLNIRAPVCVHIVLNQTVRRSGTVSHSPPTIACPDTRAPTDRCGEAGALLAAQSPDLKQLVLDRDSPRLGYVQLQRLGRQARRIGLRNGVVSSI